LKGARFGGKCFNVLAMGIFARLVIEIFPAVESAQRGRPGAFQEFVPIMSEHASDGSTMMYDAANLRDTAGGPLQLFADQSGVVRIGRGLKPSSVLPTERKSSLHDDDGPRGILVGSFHSG
jgi:hypothetical protein